MTFVKQQLDICCYFVVTMYLAITVDPDGIKKKKKKEIQCTLYPAKCSWSIRSFHHHQNLSMVPRPVIAPPPEKSSHL